MKEKVANADLCSILPEDVAKDVKDAAEISMGTEISETDEKHILALCDQIIELVDYRSSLQ
jgi:nucleolar protein 58